MAFSFHSHCITREAAGKALPDEEPFSPSQLNIKAVGKTESSPPPLNGNLCSRARARTCILQANQKLARIIDTDFRHVAGDGIARLVDHEIS